MNIFMNRSTIVAICSFLAVIILVQNALVQNELLKQGTLNSAQNVLVQNTLLKQGMLNSAGDCGESLRPFINTTTASSQSQHQLEDKRNASQLAECKLGALTIEREYNHTIRCPPWETIVTYDHRARYKLYVVYFLNCKIHDGYGGWMRGQLRHVPSDAFLKIVAVSRDCKTEHILYDTYAKLFDNRDGPTLIDCHDEKDEETFEYNGIRAVWEIGQMLHPGRDDIVFYFHSKGLTHFKTWGEYQLSPDSKLADNILGQVNRTYEVFDLFPGVNKVGPTTSQEGWVWYNFWFVRASYLRRVVEPIQTTRRHYYEDWLARTGLAAQEEKQYLNHPANRTEGLIMGRSMDGYSLHADANEREGATNLGTYYCPVNGWVAYDGGALIARNNIERID